MSDNDMELARRVRDIVAVMSDDLDAVSYDVEDGVVYIEGVVPTEEQRDNIAHAVSRVEGVEQLVTCLSTEHVLPTRPAPQPDTLVPPPVYMHYYSLS